MKRYLIFAGRFLFLYSILQVLVGLFLTYMYTPDVEEAWKASANLSQEVIIKSSQSPFIITVCIAFLSASIAYFIPSRFIKN